MLKEDVQKIIDGCISDEPLTMEWINTFMTSNQVFLDIGANVGTFSIIAGKHGCLVYGFEPVLSCYNLLVYNIFCNQLETKVFPFPYAVSSQDGTGVMYVNDSALWVGKSSLGHPNLVNGRVFSEKKCLVCTVDGFCKEMGITPNHIKIDVEGGEKDVLDGMTYTITQKNLVSVMVEVFDVNSRLVDKFFTNNGFILYKSEPHKHYGFITNKLYIRREMG